VVTTCHISIITPTFNHEKFISECIKSVLAQTYQNWEIIIIDDGSTDQTGEVVAKLQDHRIKYIYQDNVGINGLVNTYNRALTMAEGDLIAILEGDDWWPANKLATQVNDFDNEEVVLSFGYTQETSTAGDVIKLIPAQVLPEEALYNTPVGRSCLYLMDMNVLTFLFPVSVVVRRSALIKIGGFQQLPYLPLVDYPTFLHLARQGKFVFHDEILGYWRRHSESTTMNKFYLINEGVFRYLTAFQSEYAASLPVSAGELQAVNREWQEYKWHQWFTLGRWFLADGEWSQARRAFARCRSYAFNWKHPSLLKYCQLSSYCHRNIEWLITILHLKSLRESKESFNHEHVTLCKQMLDEL
jgi:glycosyltransferase involved in cell wall biosynthesis